MVSILTRGESSKKCFVKIQVQMTYLICCLLPGIFTKVIYIFRVFPGFLSDSTRFTSNNAPFHTFPTTGVLLTYYVKNIHSKEDLNTERQIFNQHPYSLQMLWILHVPPKFYQSFNKLLISPMS